MVQLSKTRKVAISGESMWSLQSDLISAISGSDKFIYILRPTKSINRLSFESDITEYSTGNLIREFDYRLQMFLEKKWQIKRTLALFGIV